MKTLSIKPFQRRRPRRGIVLLVVISLLALFILMGITFALVSSQYKYAGELERQDQRVGDPPETEMDLILGQILYDTAARTSLQYHSLLRDLYGYDDQLPVSVLVGPQQPEARDTVQGLVTNVTGNNAANTGNNQLFTFQFTKATSSPYTALSPLPNYYAGRVITLKDGPAANHSSRVVAYQPNFNPSGAVVSAQLTIESIESKLAGPVQPVNGNTFVINGAPFNGAGAGYLDSRSPGSSLDAVYQQPDPANSLASLQGVFSALVPHYAAYQRAQNSIGYTANAPVDFGGLDETWDAPDLQNMFLAMVPPRVATGGYLPIIPSFHRPELVNYWLANTPGDRAPLAPNVTATAFATQPAYQKQRDFLRTFVFRPMPWDHPNFSGSNVNFSPSYTVDKLVNALIGRDYNGNLANLWDVDNDNDGVPDSIWIDPGLPVITTKDGRRYKRLTAILIKDLDGSINVNAHGNLAQLANANYRAETALQVGMTGSTYTAPSGNALGLAPQAVYAPRGIGYGPAEVDLLRVLTGTQPALSDANALQAAQNIMYRRYDSNNTNDNGVNSRPGLVGTRDPLSIVKHYGIPNDYGNLQNLPFSTWYNLTPNWYYTPPDVWGVGTVGLDVGGQPIWGNAGRQVEMSDPPYEISLNGESNNTDSPFTAAELERLLRYHDADAAQLPGRLLQAGSAVLATDNPGSPGNSQHIRNSLTTVSSHIPAPPLALPLELRGAIATFTASSGMKLPGNTTILDLYAYKLLSKGLPPGQLAMQMNRIVPWEFFKGQKFDLNRWLGDGLDDNDGQRDDLYEAQQAERAWPFPVNNGLPTSFQSPSAPGILGQHTNTVPFFGPNSNTTLPLDNQIARQLYARHLFCLAMLFLPDNFNPDVPAGANYDAALAGSAGMYRRMMIRRIAQWAVNCVDYRDQDSVMTAFEFDYSPFDADGWAVDGNLNTTGADEVQFVNGTSTMVPMDPNLRGVVWGMEQPELLITETLAFHDRRVKDTAYGTGTNGNRLRTDSNPGMYDATLDQFRVPQGSAFVELYCPLPTLWGGAASQQRNQKPLSSLSSVQMGVNPAGSPIWRMAFSKLCRQDSTDSEHAKSPWHLVGDQSNASNFVMETASFDPANISYMPGSVNSVQVDRYAYFCPYANVPTIDQNRAFYVSSGAAPQIQPGQYAVVGPRTTTYLGSQDPLNANPPATPAGTLWGGNSKQRIDIVPANVTVRDTNGNTTSRTAGTDIRQPLGIICDMAGVTPLTGPAPGVPWSAPCPWNIGLNVSEPLPTYPGSNYYREPMPAAVPAGAVPDFYDDPSAPVGTFPGDPLDSNSNQVPANAGRPLPDLAAASGAIVTRTATDLESTVYLQRLADPSEAYNPTTNPYITVDWATMDVTVFSGEEDTTRSVPASGADAGNPIDSDDPPPGAGAGRIRFRTRQRGYHGGTLAAQYNPWSPVTQNVGGGMLRTPGSSTYFSVDLSNNKDGSYIATNPDPDRHTLGYLNETVDQLTTVNGYLGEPVNPMPWLTWNNRPFSNPMELLCVPSSSPARAGFEFSAGNGLLAQFMGQGPYADGTNPQAMPFRSPFSNLLNFFYFDAGNQPQEMQLCRLLDFVEVPSPYAGTERWYNPNSFGSYASGQFGGVTPAGFNSPIYYRPPFNKLSRFRDPGRININTIFDDAIWEAAVGMFPGMTANTSGGVFPNAVYQSRQGYGGGVLSMNSSAPTRFANPFRTADSSDLAPNISGMRKSPADATLLRSNPTTLTPQQPLFQINNNNGVQYPQWTYPNGAWHDLNRNPYFRYQALQKMGNIFSTTSNCFAVWITVGYFEVEDYRPNGTQVVIDAAHPDGLSLSQEVGADSGEVTRHRSFFIIDRSVPVGFIPGSRLNTDDCVLVRRLIE